jgi:hypothetical protein
MAWHQCLLSYASKTADLQVLTLFRLICFIPGTWFKIENILHTAFVLKISAWNGLNKTTTTAEDTYPVPWGTATCLRREWGPSWRTRSRNEVGLLEQRKVPLAHARVRCVCATNSHIPSVRSVNVFGACTYISCKELPRLIMREAVPPLPHTSSWPDEAHKQLLLRVKYSVYVSSHWGRKPDRRTAFLVGKNLGKKATEMTFYDGVEQQAVRMVSG